MRSLACCGVALLLLCSAIGGPSLAFQQHNKRMRNEGEWCSERDFFSCENLCFKFCREFCRRCIRSLFDAGGGWSSFLVVCRTDWKAVYRDKGQGVEEAGGSIEESRVYKSCSSSSSVLKEVGPESKESSSCIKRWRSRPLHTCRR